MISPDSELYGTEAALAPRANFDNIGSGMATIFIIFIGDDWNSIMALHYRAEGQIALVFFPVIYISLNLIMLNLFLAILLGNFDVVCEETEDDQTQLEAIQMKQMTRSVRKNFKRISKVVNVC